MSSDKATTGGRIAALEAEVERLRGVLRIATEAPRLTGLEALAAENVALKAELRIIANATPSQWEPDMRDQFQAWAQNRARAALSSPPQPAEALRTGEEWCALLYPDMTIYDADGWRTRGWHTQITQITREEFEAAFAVSTIAPKPQPAEAGTGGEAWIPVADRMAPPEVAVLVSLLYDVNYQGRYDPKIHPVVRHWTRAMWVPRFHRENTGDWDEDGYDDGDHNEANDTYYWPEGWYETPLEGERYWRLTEREYTVTHWQAVAVLDTAGEASQ